MFVTVCGKTPRDLGAAFVAGTAVVAGDVTLEAGSTVWYGAVLRGDEGSILVGENCNVQDNAVLALRPRQPSHPGAGCDGGPRGHHPRGRGGGRQPDRDARHPC